MNDGHIKLAYRKSMYTKVVRGRIMMTMMMMMLIEDDRVIR